ncbi:hypothetical protein N9L68_03265 [bacterium]|nr:hypothetical protein [bacterium]
MAQIRPGDLVIISILCCDPIPRATPGPPRAADLKAAAKTAEGDLVQI